MYYTLQPITWVKKTEMIKNDTTKLKDEIEVVKKGSLGWLDGGGTVWVRSWRMNLKYLD